MKRPCLTIILALVSFAAEAQQTTLGIPGTPVTEKHAFGGVAVPIDLDIDAPLGAHVDVRADLLQLADALAVPLQKDLAVSNETDFSVVTHRTLLWTVTLPPVKRVSRMVVQFRLREGGGPWQPAGCLTITVYPEKLHEWQSIVERAGLRLAVFGRADGLRPTLEAYGIRYTDLGMELPARLPAGITSIGETGVAPWREWLEKHPEQKGAFIVFCPDPEALPSISTEAQDGLCITKMTFPLFKDLAIDPRAQKTLATLINHTTDLAAPRRDYAAPPVTP